MISRLSGLSDPGDPTQGFDGLSGSWPATDLAGWAEHLPDAVEASEPESTTLGGLKATRVVVHVGDIDCALGTRRCVAFGADQGTNTRYLRPRTTYLIWIVDQGPELPLAVIVADNDPQGEWFETAEQLLSGLAFGPIGPSPVMAVPTGQAGLPFLGGIRMQITDEAAAVQAAPTFWHLSSYDEAGEIEFIINPLDAQGNPLTTAEGVLDYFGTHEAEMVEVASTKVGGLDARVFDLSAVSPSIPLMLSSVDGFRWRPPAVGRIWLIEHPDRGLIMISAESYLPNHELEERIVARATKLLASLEFVELS